MLHLKATRYVVRDPRSGEIKITRMIVRYADTEGHDCSLKVQRKFGVEYKKATVTQNGDIEIKSVVSKDGWVIKDLKCEDF